MQSGQWGVSGASGNYSGPQMHPGPSREGWVRGQAPSAHRTAGGTGSLPVSGGETLSCVGAVDRAG